MTTTQSSSCAATAATRGRRATASREHIACPDGLVDGGPAPTVCRAQALFAYSPRRDSPEVSPTCGRTQAPSGPAADARGRAKTEYVSLDIARDGAWLVALGILADRRLFVFDLASGASIAWISGDAPQLPVTCAWAEFSPVDRRSIVSGGDEGILFWTLDDDLDDWRATARRGAARVGAGDGAVALRSTIQQDAEAAAQREEDAEYDPDGDEPFVFALDDPEPASAGDRGAPVLGRPRPGVGGQLRAGAVCCFDGRTGARLAQVDAPAAIRARPRSTSPSSWREAGGGGPRGGRSPEGGRQGGPPPSRAEPQGRGPEPQRRAEPQGPAGKAAVEPGAAAASGAGAGDALSGGGGTGRGAGVPFVEARRRRVRGG